MEVVSLNSTGRVSSPSQGQSTDSAVSKHWSVSELTLKIKGLLEPSFHQVWIQGEVSNYRPASSGHLYFSLKDEQSSIGVASFGWGAKRRNFQLKDGMKVLCRGKVSVYVPRGNYQLVVDQIEPLGQGDLQLAFEQLKERLLRDGLFDASRKVPLPKYPTRIAVVTSPGGAAIQDMLQILRRRAPFVEVLVVPSLVQGEGAPEQLVRGVLAAERFRLGDVIVLARGGGSMEDLWSFNDERLARAIASCQLPVLSAVGHEIDFTISDFVSDLRAPTPSAAAEILTQAWVAAPRQLVDLGNRLQIFMKRDLTHRKLLLQQISARLVSPKDKLRDQAQRLDEVIQRLERAIRLRIARSDRSLSEQAGKLEALSPLKVLSRGYTLVRSLDEESGAYQGVVKSAGDIQSGQKFEITFHDGQKEVQAL